MKNFRRLLLFVLSIAYVTGFAQSGSFTLDQVKSYPFPNGLAVAKKAEARVKALQKRLAKQAAAAKKKAAKKATKKKVAKRKPAKRKPAKKKAAKRKPAKRKAAKKRK